MAAALLVPSVIGSSACGGKVDEPDPATTSPSTSANSPKSTSSGSGCERACDHMIRCIPSSEERSSCIASCSGTFPHPGAALTFGTCLEALSCAEIEAGRYLDYGPIGACYAKGHKR